MKIYSDNFRKYYKIMETLNEKGNPIRECAYFNFNDGYIYFSSNEGAGRFKFNFEKELTEEVIPNFFIPIPKLISIINQYDDINLSDSFVFSNGKDKYKVNTIVDDDQIDTTIFSKVYSNQVQFEKDQLDKISKAISFASKDDPAFQAIFIEDNYISSMVSKTPLYESKFNCSSKIVLPLFTAKLLLMLSNGQDCSLYSEQNTQKIVSSDTELEVIVSSNNQLEFPPNRSENFIESYTHNNLLEVNSLVFQKTIDSLKAYFNDIQNSKIKIIIGENLDITIKIEDKTTDIEKHFEATNVVPSLTNTSFAISGTKVLQTIGSLKGDSLFIDLPTEENKPIVNFYADSSEHILVTRFKE